MAAATPNPDNYLRVCKCIHLVVHEAIQCVDNAVKVWHVNHQQRLSPCTGQCPPGKKPKSPASCQNCVAWGQAVEGAFYQPPTVPASAKPPQLTWSNVTQSDLGKNYMEVAKAFVLRLSSNQTTTSMSDFDSAKLLMIMARFSGFHYGDQRSFDAIMKVSDIRNDVSHMTLKDNMFLDEQKMKQYFQDIMAFVACLETLHPQFFNTTKDIRGRLKEIQLEPITAKMKEDILCNLSLEMQSIQKQVDNLSDIFSRTVTTSEESGADTQDAILRQCQERLRLYYLEFLCKIPLLPGDYDSYVDLQDIYTNVSLEIDFPQPCRPVKMPLASYDEMITRQTREGNFYTKVLLTGPAGSGKTTLSAKIAYDWAKQVEGSPLRDITLLFVLNMRGISRTSNIENAILNQLLPDDTTITEEEIRSMIQRNGEKVIIILDAIDESDRDLYDKQESCGNIVNCLMGRYISACRLLVTTRPWRIAEIRRRCKSFTKVELSGFNNQDVRKYIRKFFTQDKSLGDSLIEHLNQNPLTNELATVPLMTLLICIYWREMKGKDLPRKIGPSFDAIMNYTMYHQYMVKHDDLLTTDVEGGFRRLQRKMGKMALQGFWPPNNRIVFSPEEAESSGDVEMACQVGLISQQVIRASGLTTRKQTTLTFFHKTCGEKCAGVFLASLAEGNSHELSTTLSALKTVQEALSVQLILQFACGSNITAADMVMSKLMDIYALEVKPLMTEYCNEMMEFEESLQVHRFIDLCLRCNYEAGCHDRYNHLLKDIFPRGKVHFFGISAFTAVALGYYLTHSRPDPIWLIAVVITAKSRGELPPTEFGHIRSITLRVRETGKAFLPYTPLEILRARAYDEAKHIPISVKQGICMEYFVKHPSIPLPYSMALLNPSLILASIKVWQAFEGLPNSRESNIRPILDSLKHIHLQVFNISDMRIGDININHLLKTIDENHLTDLLELHVSNIGMNGYQTDLLAQRINKMPHLQELNISGPFNESNKSLLYLAESLSCTQHLTCIHASRLYESAKDMAGFVNLFHRFGAQLLVLRIECNYMDNATASVFTKYLPTASLLTDFAVSVNGLSKTHHNEFLLAIRRLSRLKRLDICDSPYPDDMMVSMAHVLCYLPILAMFSLNADPSIPLAARQVKSDAYRIFKISLRSMNKLKALTLQDIALVKEDFIDLVLLCRRMQYIKLGYAEACLPDVEEPKDDFFRLY